MPEQPQGHIQPPADHPAVRTVRRQQAELHRLKEEADRVRATRDAALAQLMREGYTPGKTARAVGMSTQTVRNIKLAVLAKKKDEAEN
jgi:hypothetical protein